ncbi:MAG: pilus assembly protein PilM [Opitutaceae bacterium]|nr:pilus assembly protein PilM [Opitutaceae bacterium]
MRSPRILAVDVGASHVACGVFTAGATGRLVLQHFAYETHSPDPSNESRWAVEVAQSLGSVGSRRKLGGTSALAVPGHLALTKFVKTPSVAKEKRGKIIGFEAAENIPYPLEEVVWDYAVVSDDSFDLEVMLAAVKFDAMQALCTSADASGFPVERAIPAGLALRHSFRYSHPQVHDSVVVANIGARSTNLLFLDNGRFYLRTLPLAGNTVTHSIAEELRIDFAQAETLKVQVLSGHSDLPASSPSRLAVQRSAANFAGRLQLEITRSTINHRRQSGAAAPVALYVTGGGSQMPDLPAALAEKLKISVERFEPLRQVDLSADARAAGAESAQAALADLVGLATRLVVPDEPEASLLPPAITETIAFRKRQPAFIAAAVLGVLALLPPIVYFHSVASATLQHVARIDDQLMPLRSLEHRNAENLRQIDDARKQIAALRGAYDTKANWVNFFADLQDRLVKIEDVWLDRLEVVRPVADLNDLAAAPTPPPAATDAPAASGETPPPAENAPPPEPQPPPPPPAVPVRLALSGRLLDVANPQSKVSAESFERVKRLLASFTDSDFIAAVENERFDNNQNGLLRFDFTLVVNPKKPL